MTRQSHFVLPLLALAFLSSGCGTITNITAESTVPGGYRAYGPTWCEPFGGVQRSVLIGSYLLVAGPVGWVGAIYGVGVDAPLSLMGDVLTLPYVYYRIRNSNSQTPKAFAIPQVAGASDDQPRTANSGSLFYDLSDGMGAGAPRSRPAVLKSSSISGQ